MTNTADTLALDGYAGRGFGRDGPPRCLLLHGFTGRCEDWRRWPDDAPSALAIDLPGHGGSPDPSGTFDAEVARLLAALPNGIDRLVGYSLGGRIALALLAAAPGRFAAVTVLSAHPGLGDAAERDERRAADRRWIELLRSDGIEPFVKAWERQPVFATQRRLPREALAAQRRQRLGQRAEGLASCLECLGLAGMPDTWDAVQRYTGRLVWIVGEADAKFLHIARRVAGQRPRTGLHVLPGIGHNPLLEAPERLRALWRETTVHGTVPPRKMKRLFHRNTDTNSGNA